MVFEVEQLNGAVDRRGGTESLSKRQSLTIRRPGGIKVGNRTKGDLLSSASGGGQEKDVPSLALLLRRKSDAVSLRRPMGKTHAQQGTSELHGLAAIGPAAPECLVGITHKHVGVRIWGSLHIPSGDTSKVGKKLARARVVAHQLGARLLCHDKQFFTVTAGSWRVKIQRVSGQQHGYGRRFAQGRVGVRKNPNLARAPLEALKNIVASVGSPSSTAFLGYGVPARQEFVKSRTIGASFPERTHELELINYTHTNPCAVGGKTNGVDHPWSC